MTSEDFVKIFYSNFTPNIDWDNIDEIAWMHQEGLFTISSQVLAQPDEFITKIDFVLDSKNGFSKSGENDGHLALKSFAKDYLTSQCGVFEKDIKYEYPLIGFEVDVIDKDLYFPTECGDTNALKLEKYLALPATKKVLILPYPHSAEVKVFEFVANPRFFEYVKHKQAFLNQKNAKLR
ncbi:hypothetical protein HY383_03500 [Candidatus Daviesbacteria bacterium]|nr:hypothetical protein [Candidatus Daviesbacteria bacterium]